MTFFDGTTDVKNGEKKKSNKGRHILSLVKIQPFCNDLHTVVTLLKSVKEMLSANCYGGPHDEKMLARWGEDLLHRGWQLLGTAYICYGRFQPNPSIRTRNDLSTCGTAGQSHENVGRDSWHM